MSNIKILILEDEPALLEGLVTYLNLKGFTADGVSTIKSAELWMQTHVFDILILDLGLGDEDGLEWLKSKPELKQKGLIIISARIGDNARIAGAMAGADVFMVKPVLLGELVATLHNLTRRLQLANSPPWLLNNSNWTLESPDHQLIKLTHFEANLLSCLMAGAAGEMISKETLILALGHDFASYDPAALDRQINRLRSKFKQQSGGDLPLQTVHGKGYAFTGQLRKMH